MVCDRQDRYRDRQRALGRRVMTVHVPAAVRPELQNMAKLLRDDEMSLLPVFAAFAASVGRPVREATKRRNRGRRADGVQETKNERYARREREVGRVFAQFWIPAEAVAPMKILASALRAGDDTVLDRAPRQLREPAYIDCAGRACRRIDL